MRPLSALGECAADDIDPRLEGAFVELAREACVRSQVARNREVGAHGRSTGW